YGCPTGVSVLQRGAAPVACESNVVIYDEMNGVELEKELYLEDAISDLPPVRVVSSDHRLYDHLPYKCNADDFELVCQIPKRKGANFRDLPGVIVNEYNEVGLDNKVERKKVASGKPLVSPDYALKFVKGKSSKPFGRLWWDEIVSTVVTRPQPHNQAILHPVQDRVLTVRESARLQGFPGLLQAFWVCPRKIYAGGQCSGRSSCKSIRILISYVMRRSGLKVNQPWLESGFKKRQAYAHPTRPQLVAC
ncbi:DNA (cytosine-5)-methyltransferase CMT3-like protein, partial [Tanacetum coccineum]